jgi:hypothetical protein
MPDENNASPTSEGASPRPPGRSSARFFRKNTEISSVAGIAPNTLKGVAVRRPPTDEARGRSRAARALETTPGRLPTRRGQDQRRSCPWRPARRRDHWPDSRADRWPTESDAGSAGLFAGLERASASQATRRSRRSRSEAPTRIGPTFAFTCGSPERIAVSSVCRQPPRDLEPWRDPAAVWAEAPVSGRGARDRRYADPETPASRQAGP